MQSARRRLSDAEASRQAAFKVHDQRAAIAQAEAPRIRRDAGLGATIIAAGRAASWRDTVRESIASIGGDLRGAIAAAGAVVEQIEGEVTAVEQAARYLRGEGDLPEGLPADMTAALGTVRQSDPAAAVILAASLLDAAEGVGGQVRRAHQAHGLAREAGEVTRHKLACAMLQLAGETRAASAAALLRDRAASRLKDLRRQAQ